MTKKIHLVAITLSVFFAGCGVSYVANPGFCYDDSDCTTARGFAPEQNKCIGETNDLATRWRCIAPNMMNDGSADSSPGSDSLPGSDTLAPEVGLDTGVPLCTNNAQCKDILRPICGVSGVCQPCSANSCQGALSFCSATGACVACLRSMDCPAATPICSTTGTCSACNSPGAPADGCSKRDAAHAVCATSVAKVGQCVGCVDDTTCTSSIKPICDAMGTNECRGCATDTECKGGPGVCMSHQDGRCATDAETIYVQDKDCTAGTGAAGAPLCSPQDAPGLFTANRRLVVVRGSVDRFQWSLSGQQISVVGQSDASIAGGGSSAIRIAGGDFYARNIIATLSAKPGIVGESNAKIRLQNVTASGNPGGGVYLDGTTFEIRDSTVVDNGPGQTGAIGGIAIVNQPATGPAKLERVTVRNNKAVGISCAAPVMATGVLAFGNTAVDIAAACQAASCSAGTPNCGAP